MGAKFQFRCLKCGHEELVSGGDDVGMACATTTVCCEDCEALFDVVISVSPEDESARVPDSQLVCPGYPPDDVDEETEKDFINPNHRVHRWSHPGACPQCGELMRRGDAPVVLWDQGIRMHR